MKDHPPKKPVIFLSFANDRDDSVGYLRNLPDEARRLRAVLETAEHSGLCEVVVRTNSTAEDIFNVFQDPRYRNRVAIFHYGGHANGYQLLLESAAGQVAVADAGGFAAFLAQQQGLQLVFLNGCSTQLQTQALHDANISAVISTSRAIEDQVASDFAFHFYQGLAGGSTIRRAYREAETSVQTASGGKNRGLYFGANDDSASIFETDRWPWRLTIREGSEHADQWNLPAAVNDPLFGLPPLPKLDLPESPYRHLNCFTRKEAEIFFGRGHQIRELYDRLTAPLTTPIVLFYGQSGVGKSSILAAGLIPRLEQEYEVRYLRRGDKGLLNTLKQAFVPEAIEVPIDEAWRMTEEQLNKPLIVFLDQVEEHFTRPLLDMSDELEQLLKAIQAIFKDPFCRPRGKLVLGFRKEWLAELESQLITFELPRTKLFLESLDRRGIVEVVRGPASSPRLSDRYGLTIEDGLAEIIADDLLQDRGSSIAPTLQILLTKMWTKATETNYEHPLFSQNLYLQLKREGILLRDFLDQQIEIFRQKYPEVVDSGLLLDLLAQHTTSLGTADHRSIEHLRQQYPHLEITLPEILQLCQDLHLLTVTTGAQKDLPRTTRLAHDTLAPIVREQFDQSDKPGQRARRVLDSREVDWADNKSGPPLDEADLKLVEQGVNGTRIWNSMEERLIQASREKREINERQQRSRERLIVALVSTLLLAVGVGVFGWRAKSRAELEERFRTAVETITRAGGAVAVAASKNELIYRVDFSPSEKPRYQQSNDKAANLLAVIGVEADPNTGHRHGEVFGSFQDRIETKDIERMQTIPSAALRSVCDLPNVHLIVNFDTEQALRTIFGFRNIHAVTLGGRFDEACLQWLAQLPNLASIDLSNTNIGDVAAIHLAKIHSLQKIDLTDTQISDEGLSALHGLPHLREVNAKRTQVTNAGFVGFRRAKPNTKLLLDKLALFKDEMSLAFSESDLTVDDDFELVAVKVRDKATDTDMEALRETPRLNRVEFTTSRITDKGLSQIVAHPQIREVRFKFQNGPVTDLGLTYLATLPNLEILDLGELGATVTDEGIEHFKYHPMLRVLRIDGQSKSRLTPKILSALATCNKLEELEIRSVYMAGQLGQLANMPRLRVLTLQNCALTDADILTLSDVKNLARIDLCDNKDLTSDCLTGLRDVTKLQRLSVRNTKITREAIAQAGLFSNLTIIDMVDMEGDVGFNENNQPIILVGRGFTDSECAKLSLFKTLQSVHLYGCEEVTDEGLSCLSKLPLLKQLVISNHACTDAGLRCLAELSNLEDLQVVNGRGIEGPGVADLTKLSMLRRLTLTSFNFDGTSLRYLYGLTQLEELRLGNAYFPDEDIESLTDALPGVVIDWQKPGAETVASIAWVLATHPNEKIRNGKRALQLATEACRVTEFHNPNHLEALAASYAEIGDFEAAKKWQTNAISLAPRVDIEQYTTKLNQYERGKPCRLTIENLQKLMLQAGEVD